jgi:ParB family transcriptional regulator, chromosome partitioning protein
MMAKIDLIYVGERLRKTTPEQVQALAASMAEVGLLSPITVYERQVVPHGIAVPGFGLVAGLHRLEAARSLGWEEIAVQVVTLPDLARQLAECDENLCGAKLTPAERSLFTVRRKHIYEALHPETKHGGNREPSRQVGDMSRFTADTAARTGRSERDVQRDATRGERIGEDVLAAVKGTALDKGTVLDTLARASDPRAALREIQSKPAPAIKNAFESEEDWRRQLFTIWNRGAQDWRERAMEAMDRPVFDRSRCA